MSDRTYFDTASIGLMSARTRETLAAWMEAVGRGGTACFDEEAEEGVTSGAEGALARLLGVPRSEVTVGSSATELLTSVAWALSPAAGTNVVVPAMSFPSTLQPWARVARATGAELRLAGEACGPLRPDDVVRAIDGRTAVVCVSDVEYRTGQRHDLAALADRASALGALLVVDASQSLGLLRLRPREAGIDVLVASGYKWLCGPLGVAALYVAEGIADRLDPGTVGFRSRRDMWAMEGTEAELASGAARFQSGSFFYGSALGLANAVAELEARGATAIESHGTGLADRLREGLLSLGIPVRPGADESVAGIVAIEPGDAATRVEEALRRARVCFSRRGLRLRFSVHHYNRADEVEQVVDVVARALRG